MKIKVIEKAVEPVKLSLLDKEGMDQVKGRKVSCDSYTISNCMLFHECGTNPEVMSAAYSTKDESCSDYYTWTSWCIIARV